MSQPLFVTSIISDKILYLLLNVEVGILPDSLRLNKGSSDNYSAWNDFISTFGISRTFIIYSDEVSLKNSALPLPTSR